MTTDSLLEKIWERKLPFFAIFFVAVFLTYSVLYALNFYPEPPAGNDSEPSVEETATSTDDQAANTGTTTAAMSIAAVAEPEVPKAPEVSIQAAYPQTMYFDSLDREVTVLNPQSREVSELDAALLSGVVRHPDSASFRDPGTMFILGHSSYLPTVHNQNFRAFNGIQNLEWGDTIRVRSTETEYVYRVDRVYEAKASDAYIPLQWDEAELVLATCDSFGTVEDRFMVEASLIDTVTL